MKKKSISLMALLLLLLTGCHSSVPFETRADCTENYVPDITDIVMNDILFETEDITDDIVRDIIKDIYHSTDENSLPMQEIRVYSPDADTPLLTLTDDDALSGYLSNICTLLVQETFRPRHISAVPKDAAALYIFELWEEDAIHSAHSKEDVFLNICSTTLYSCADEYCLSIVLSDEMAEVLSDLYKEGRIYISLDDVEAKYYCNLAEEAEVPPLTDKAKDITKREDFYIESRSDFSYEDIARVSKHQKIEVVPADASEPSFSITNLSDITDFLNNESPNEWSSVNKIPDDAKKICDIIRYAAARKTIGIKLEEQYRDVLLKADDGYFMAVIITVSDGLPEAEAPKYFRVPDSVGENLSRLCE